MAFDNGLRKHLFINVPPEDRNPATVGNTTAAAEMKEHIALFNSALANHIIAFSERNPSKFDVQLLHSCSYLSLRCYCNDIRRERSLQQHLGQCGRVWIFKYHWVRAIIKIAPALLCM